jgi:hypothetical protein
MATTGGTNPASGSTSFTLAVTATDQSFTLASDSASYPVTAGASASVTITLTPGANGFNLPVTYTCTDPAPESTCTGPSGATTTSPVSFSITTTAPVGEMRSPFSHGSRMFYALLLPGFLGIIFVAGSKKRSARGAKLLGLIVVLGFSTMWLGSCGGSSSSTKNPGTAAGSYTITINATTGGSVPITSSQTVKLVVQ